MQRVWAAQDIQPPSFLEEKNMDIIILAISKCLSIHYKLQKLDFIENKCVKWEDNNFEKMHIYGKCGNIGGDGF